MGVDFPEAQRLWGGDQAVRRKDGKNARKDRVQKRGRFNGVIIKLPMGTCILLPGGAVTVVGVKSFSVIGKVGNYLLSTIPAMGEVPLEYEKPLEVCNIVASMSTGHPIRLPDLYRTLSPFVHMVYTPEMFPGMTICLRGSLVGVVFHSGKVNITGAKTLEDLKFAETTITQYLEQLLMLDDNL